jgi:hypothetical protein
VSETRFYALFSIVAYRFSRSVSWASARKVVGVIGDVAAVTAGT